jgi:hypothetical protein
MSDSRDIRDPEALFYFARHCGMLGCDEPTIQMIRRARLAGFWSSRTLTLDPVFAGIRDHAAFRTEVDEALRLEAQCCEALAKVLGRPFTPSA